MMKNLTLENIALACRGQLYGKESLTKEDRGREAESVVLDSRLMIPGGVFIATRGERVDGHRFISQVFVKGALAAVCEELPEPLPGPCILVEDSFQALKDVAKFYRSQLDIKVIGITGSVGKTSTKEFIAGVLSSRFRLWKTQGNFNNEVGLPLTVLQLREEHQVAVLEMGISQFGEMHRLSEIAKPDICVITNIGQCHLEFLKDREGVLKAKSEILDFWSGRGPVCVNGDDDKLITLEKVNGKPVVTYGKGTGNSCYAEILENKGLFGTKMLIHTPKDTFEATIPLPGEHMIYNALAATAVGITLGLTGEEIAAGIGAVQPSSGRCNIISCKDRVLIDDCYNANPVSTCAAIDLLEKADTRKVAVLGDMFELGDDEAKMHAQVGEHAVEKGIDLLICVGELSEHMAKAAESLAEKEGKAVKVVYYKEKDKMLSEIENLLEPEDTILIKASHGMGFAEVVEKLNL